LRRCLYLAALTASRFDPRFRAFKERLIATGKAKKLVIVACARKLLTVLNAMTRTGTAYHDAST
jgi:transposase